MIQYSSGGLHHLTSVFQLTGSVFPTAFMVSLPCSLICAVLRALISLGYIPQLSSDGSILKETQAWSGFSFLVGFLVVFRTSQSHSRFWDGCTATHQMRAEWFDACCSLVAFCRHSKQPVEKINTFKSMLVRLFSMLHAAALTDLEMMNMDHAATDAEEAFSFRFDIIDPAGFDNAALSEIKTSTCKVELIFSWIQLLIVESIDTGVLNIPAPLLSRSFQEIANGMVAFHDAVKISYIPFPFPYAQICDCLLLIHWVVVPFVVSQWVSHPLWGGIFVFIQVFILWCLNFVAVEIENPFGLDANDIDGAHMQLEMNRHLLLLMAPCLQQAPKLKLSACQLMSLAKLEDVPLQSFHHVLSGIGGETALTARRGAHFCRGDKVRDVTRTRSSKALEEDSPEEALRVLRPSNFHAGTVTHESRSKFARVITRTIGFGRNSRTRPSMHLPGAPSGPAMLPFSTPEAHEDEDEDEEKRRASEPYRIRGLSTSGGSTQVALTGRSTLSGRTDLAFSQGLAGSDHQGVLPSAARALPAATLSVCKGRATIGSAASADKSFSSSCAVPRSRPAREPPDLATSAEDGPQHPSRLAEDTQAEEAREADLSQTELRPPNSHTRAREEQPACEDETQVKPSLLS